MAYLLTKSKYIRGLQCPKAMFLDVHAPHLAYYPPETLARFRRGRDFEKSFKDTFPHGIDISARLKGNVSAYPQLTADLLSAPGEVALFEAGFLYNDVLVLADVVHKTAEGVVTIFEVKNSTQVSETFRNDVAIQHYVISHALPAIVVADIFCQGLTLQNFFVLFNDGHDGFLREDLIQPSQSQHSVIEQNINHFKQVILGQEPSVPMSPHCDAPYACPYKGYCRKRGE